MCDLNPVSRGSSLPFEPAALVQNFEDRFNDRPRVFCAPGRVNLIGEHTDYNDGFVMPAAIDFATWVAIAPRKERVLSIRSEQFGETFEFDLEALNEAPRKHWTDYVRGVAAKLRPVNTDVPGATLLISGSVPLGAGLSSSTALEVSSALALCSVWDRNLSQLEIAKLCQSAEHEYAGTRCGIMDQFVSLYGKNGNCLLLDCRSLEYQCLPLLKGASLVICNSKVKHELASGEYNRRREDCEYGVACVREQDGSVTALRDVTPELLESCRPDLPEPVYRRCRHVISENQRVLQAASALQAGDLDQFGKLMYESHESLRTDYEVSCKELDVLMDIASNIDGVFGSRMTGGGFGGCTVSLVADDAVHEMKAELERRYAERTGITADIYISSAAQGACELKVDD